jgi:type IV pilus assembly protein PilA
MLKHDVSLNKGLQKQAGFTLIELLIVIAIIAILAAIAIPQFLKYKQGAYLDSARSDVKNAVTAMEAYQATHGSYPTLPITAGPGPVSWDLGTNKAVSTGGDLNVSKDNTIKIASDSACTNGYSVCGKNSNISSGIGSTDTYGTATSVCYDSCTGAYSGF